MRVDNAVTWGGHDSSPTTRRGIENPAIAEGLEKAPWSTCMMVGHPVSSVIPCSAPTQRKDHSPLFRRCQGTVFTSSACISCPLNFISMSSNSLGFRPRIFPFSIVLHFLYTGVPSGYSLAGTVQLDYQQVVRCHRKWTESRRSPFVRCLWRTQRVTLHTLIQVQTRRNRGEYPRKTRCAAAIRSIMKGGFQSPGSVEHHWVQVVGEWSEKCSLVIVIPGPVAITVPIRRMEDPELGDDRGVHSWKPFPV